MPDLDAHDAIPSTLQRRHLLGAAAAQLLAGSAGGLLLPGSAHAQAHPGVTASEIRIGNTTSLSGPVSALGTIARAQAAYFKMVNDQGGVAGRKISFIFYDDGFNPAKTAEMARKLIEQDEVALLFGNLGTGPNSAIVRYVNQLGVPHLFLSVNGDKWTDYKSNPWSMPFAPSGRVECQVAIKHTLQGKPDAKFAIVYQNDDFGRDYIAGAKDVLGARYDAQVKALSYEVTDPTLDSVLVQLLSSPVDALISGVTGKFGAISIRKASDMGFKGAHYIATGVSSIQGVLIPAGAERATGVLSTVYAKDPSDPGMADDPGIKAYRAFMARWYPEGNPDESFNSYGYMTAMVMTRVLQQCNGDFSRRNIMAQANNLKDLENPILLPGIKINTSPSDHRPLEQMQLQRFDGKRWVRFGPVFEGSAV
ncbi:ABC transporter substrate-binding protein [Aquabacterium sp. OR-4]|uniref:ABC transporter substrate-binding protein n=1 Tax=Aquabacterium sp. OR-4 TaxID=2978127 RepID=UPI0021B1BFCB|nr:ABC transporter substrate-binding protein [Aquabacterium sp. OR-4]MDT7838839.1 ABC transporter substrate-binding protein [Aquabacterium sp. OR-4]